MIENKSLRTLTLIFALIGLGAGIGVYTAHQNNMQKPPAVAGLMWPQPKTLQSFTTVNQDGQAFGLENLQGKWSFLFFGYTNCPDICPITLTVFKTVYEKLESMDKSENVQMVFVSVDPDRDSSEQLKQYVSYFNQDFIGLGGNLEQVSNLTSQMGIAFFHEPASAEGDYLVDHAASVFLVDPRGRVIAIMSAPHQAEDILSRFSKIRSFINRQLG